MFKNTVNKHQLLKLWEQELETNQNGMQHLAKRAIKIIKQDIYRNENI